ncbi:MAG: VWA domain-containing protein [Flavobacteriaceae bacterium]|nr:VWA domain-containing protein [Flavobacteriaceae bacterium]MCY4268021.1 VWA domain-containing protein [Flavobacteriaceae bacterium]MCY4298862.1 VWA domain-containing protein [Flavobacteriaceae bacterium]
MIDQIVFKNPEFLWLLCLMPIGAIGYYLFWTSSRPLVKLPTLEGFKHSSSIISKAQAILPGLHLLALGFLILGLARPQVVDVSTQSYTSSGIDIVMAIDVSSSMLARDLKPNRLTALKEVAANFIEDRYTDRIGLVVYAGESYTKTPITSDQTIVKNALSQVSYQGVLQDGTAIGMGLATAVNRLKDSKSKSKVIILLTDGVNNSGFIDPLAAVELAKEFNIKTYTIGLGSNGKAMAPIAILPNGQFQYGLTEVEIDQELLQEIAQSTGGQYFRATDNRSLEEIYDEINKLEKTEIEELKYYNYQEMYRIPVIVGLVLLLIQWTLKKTLFRSFI